MIMAMEGRSRKLDRRDWPAFLNRIVPQGVWQSLSRSSKQSKGDPPSRDDPRIRWSRKFVVLAYIAIGWAAPRTLGERFDQARQWVVDLFPSRRRPGRTYVGLTKAAGRHGVGQPGGEEVDQHVGQDVGDDDRRLELRGRGGTWPARHRRIAELVAPWADPGGASC